MGRRRYRENFERDSYDEDDNSSYFINGDEYDEPVSELNFFETLMAWLFAS